MANAFNKLLNAAKIAEEGTLGMMGLLQQRDATNAANQLALLGAQQKTAEHNLAVNQQKANVAQSIYESFNTQLAELEKAIAADSSLKDSDAYRRQYNRVSKGRDNALKDFQRIVGIPVNSGLEVFDLVKAARAEIPADKRKFVPGTTEDILKKSFPSFTGNWQDAYDIWQLLDLQEGMQGSSTAANQKKTTAPVAEVANIAGLELDANQVNTIAGLGLGGLSVPTGKKRTSEELKNELLAGLNLTIPEAIAVLTGAKKLEVPEVTSTQEPTQEPTSSGTPEMNQQGGESPVQVVQDALAVDPDNNPSLLQSILDTLIPPAGAADFISGSDKGKALRKRRSTGMELEPEALLALGMTPLIPAGILAMMNQQGRQRPEVSGVLGTDELPIGMKYRYDPNAPLEDERNLRSASTYGAQARSGSFPIRDDERYPYAFPESQLPFTMPDGETSQLISPSEVEELQLMDKAFGTGTSGLMSLSDELGSGSGGGQVSEEAANFIRKYMQILQNSNVDEAGKRTGSAFNRLPVEVQTEIVTILEQSGIGEVNSPIPLGDTGPGIDPNLAEGQRMGGILGMLMSLGYPMGQQIGASLGMSPNWLFKNRWGGMSPPLAALAATLAPRTANAPIGTGTPLTSEQLQALANQ